MRRAIFVGVGVGLLSATLPVLVVGFFGFWMGAILGGRSSERQRFEQEQSSLQPILNSPGYENVQVHEGCDGQAYLVGEVDSDELNSQLLHKATHAIASARIKSIGQSVTVRRSKKSPQIDEE